MMANKKSIHRGNGDSPELDELLSVDGGFMAQTHDLVYSAGDLDTHLLGYAMVWPEKVERRGEHPQRRVSGGGISGEKLLDRLVDAVDGVVEVGICGEGLVEPGVELELDHLAELNGERGVVRRK
jgi:hypothetical protein